MFWCEITLYYKSFEDRQNAFGILQKSDEVAAVFPYEIPGFESYEQEQKDDDAPTKTYIVPRKKVDLLLQSKFAKLHPDYQEPMELELKDKEEKKTSTKKKTSKNMGTRLTVLGVMQKERGYR